VARWLIWVAPKIATFGAMVLTDELARANCDRTAVIAVPLTTGDVRFTLLTPDNFSSTQCKMALEVWRLYRNKVYEPVMLACLTRLLQRMRTPQFMDVGAFLGYYACYASALFSDREEVYAVESNPLYADRIRESARVNGFSRLRVFQAALSDQVEPVCIQGLTVRNDADSRSTTMTLDCLCNREHVRPNIIKMDVHGAEAKIVLGMPNTLAEVECMLLEMHNLTYMHWYSPEITRTAMLDALEDAGLTLYYVAGHHKNDGGSAYFEQLLAGAGYSYRKLDRQARDLLLFNRREDEFVLALRHDDIESLLGPSISPRNE
jgi:FkbM family methyltransferase